MVAHLRVFQTLATTSGKIGRTYTMNDDDVTFPFQNFKSERFCEEKETSDDDDDDNNEDTPSDYISSQYCNSYHDETKCVPVDLAWWPCRGNLRLSGSGCEHAHGGTPLVVGFGPLCHDAHKVHTPAQRIVPL